MSFKSNISLSFFFDSWHQIFLFPFAWSYFTPPLPFFGWRHLWTVPYIAICFWYGQKKNVPSSRFNYITGPTPGHTVQSILYLDSFTSQPVAMKLGYFFPALTMSSAGRIQ